MIKKSILILAITLVFSCSSGKKDVADKIANFTVFHTNDIHGYVSYVPADETNLEKSPGKVGLSKEKALVNTAKSEGYDVLLLDDGDVISGGDVFAAIDKGSSIVDVFNAMSVDAMSVGNHEFDYGQDRLKQLEAKMKFPLLSANVYKNGELMFTPYTIRDVGALKVGIMGLTTPETKTKTDPTGIAGIEFLSPDDEKVKKQIKDLDDKTDFIIVLAHLGIEGDWSSRLLYDIPGINLIIDGHSHTEFSKQVDKDTYIVQTGSMLQNIGRVDVSYDKGKITFNPKLIRAIDVKDVTPDDATEKEIQRVKDSQSQLTSKVITHTDRNWEGERNDVRTRRTNLGDAVALSMKNVTQSDVAITNGGGIRASIQAGDVTMGQAIAVLPFGNIIRVIEVTGQDILSALEHGNSLLPEPAGSFSQVAGLTFDVNVENPAGKRISNVKVGDADLDLKKTYTLATNDFMANGGDGYTMFAGKKVIKESNTLLDAFIEYLKSLSV